MAGQTYLPIEILDYVQTHAPAEDSAFGISQTELARALGYHPCSMSRPLAGLVEGGLLEAHRRQVRDGVRKQLTYWLTEEGRSKLRKETREVPILSGEIPAPPHPFLGRRDELAQLGDFARTEEDATIIVDGPAGMGKTALISRHLREVRRGKLPFWFTARSSSSPRQFVSALAHSLQLLGAQQLAYYSQLPKPPTAKEVADLTSRALGERRLIAVVDDAHLTTSDFRRFLKDFIRGLMRGEGHRVYFVTQDPNLGEIVEAPTHRLTVGGLDRATAHELTDRAGGLSDRFENVYQSTLGSPLLLNLAVKNPGVVGPASAIPGAVLRRLPEREIDAILPLATANEPLPLSFLTDDCGLPAARVPELTRMGVLNPTSQGQVEMLQVVRTALLNQVRPSQDHLAHVRLASFYARSHRPDSIRLRFIHLVEGEAWKAALQLLAQNERLLLSLGYSDALRNAFRHLSTLIPRGATRLRALGTEVKLLRQAANYGEAVGSLRRIIDEADRDQALTCQCHLSIADLLVRLRQLPEAKAEYERARALGPLTRRLQVFQAFVSARLSEAEGDKREAERLFQNVFEQARRYRIRDLALEAIAAWTSLSEHNREQHDEILRVISEAIPEARAEGRVDIVFNLLLVKSRAYTMAGRSDLAEAELRAIRSEAEALGYVNQLAYALSGIAALAVQAHHYDDAANNARQGISLAERLGNDLVLGHTLGILCSAEFQMADRGNRPELAQDAIIHGERSVEILGRLPASDSLAIAHGYLAEAYNFVSDRGRALEHFAAAAGLAEELGISWIRRGLTDQLPSLAAVYDALVRSDGKGADEAITT